WQCDLNSYTCEKTDASVRAQPQDTERPRSRRGDREPETSDRSPDRIWKAYVKDDNVFVSSADQPEVQLTHDGKEGRAYGQLAWSADSRTLVAFRIEPGERKEVYLVESSPSEGGRAKLHTRPYALPGDQFAKYELNIFDVATRKQIKPDIDRFEHEWLRPRLHWARDAHHFTYQQVDRGHQRLRLIEVDARTGSTRNLIDEKSETFIWTAHTENLSLNLLTWLTNSDEVIYVSERDGWRHFYL